MSFDRDRIRSAMDRTKPGFPVLRAEVTSALQAFGHLALRLDQFDGPEAMEAPRPSASDGIR